MPAITLRPVEPNDPHCCRHPLNPPRGHALASNVTSIALADVGAFLGRGDREAGARYAARALGRLPAAGLVSWSSATATVRLSGYVAPMPPALLAELPDVVVRP